MSSVSFLTLFESQKGSRYLKFNVGNFGIKGGTIELNDGRRIELTRENVLFVNDPREGVQSRLEAGKITEDKAAEIIGKLDDNRILQDIVLKVD